MLPQSPPLGMGTCASLPLPQHSVSSPIFLPSSPVSPQTLFDFSSRNYISAKQGSEASGASTTAPVSAKLNQCPQKTGFQQALHMTTSAITMHFPTNRWGAIIQEEVKRIFFPLFRSWLGWRSIQTPQHRENRSAPTCHEHWNYSFWYWHSEHFAGWALHMQELKLDTLITCPSRVPNPSCT